MKTHPPLQLPLLTLLCFAVLGNAHSFAGAEINKPVAPPQPLVPPLISKIYPADADGDHIQDRLAARARAALSALSQARASSQMAKAQAQLDAMVEVELIFNQQIVQRQLDDFLSQGSKVTHIYEAVSYGWNGSLPLGKVLALPALLGESLVQVEESVPASLHLDIATRNGRARTVWASGFAGNPSGFDGDPSITVGVVDSGVDESHMDLFGRRVFWHDYTTDAAPDPIDVVQHGTHVTGIAVGTGDASGSATGNLLFTDENDLTGVTSGSFFPSPFGMAATATTVTLVATWDGGGSTSLNLIYHTKGSSGGWSIIGGTATGTSPLTLNVSFTPNTSRVYSPALFAASGVGRYVVTVQAPNFASIGDGFNKLRGVAPGCNWAGAKAFTSSGSGSSTAISAGIDGLVANRLANNIKVMNLSIGITGDPGISTSQRAKVNTAVNNGVVVVCSAGNDGGKSTAAQREIDDPGRAALALTVAGANDVNQLTDYTSIGFTTLSSIAGQEEDYKPDLMAPGGSATYYTSIMSVDSNSGDGPTFNDQRTNDYYNVQGTSMSAPFAAGCAALVIDALQQRGTNWDFASSKHARLVKMLLCATASESNANRDSATNNPTLQRAAAGPSGYPIGKDQFEGYGMVNVDAAVEAATLDYTNGTAATATLSAIATEKRVWARGVTLPGGVQFGATLTVPAGADFDLYLYSRTPSAYGTPVLLASSTQAATGGSESFVYPPTTTTNAILVVKRVSGTGTFSLIGDVPPTAAFTASPTNGVLPLDVSFTNLSAGATSFQWNFGDGNFSSSTNPVHTYASAGSFTVTLTAMGAGTNSLSRINYITVTNPPIVLANFAAAPTNGAPPLTVNFTNLSENATNFSWDFGDSHTSALTQPVNTYSNVGVYTVTLTAIGATGTNTLTRTNYIVVADAPPSILAQPSSLTVTQGNAAAFTVSASGSQLAYQWRFNGSDIPGAASSTLDIPSAQFTNAGVYSVLVSNATSSVLSADATLTILTPLGFIAVTGPPYSQDFDSMGASGTNAPPGWYVGTGTGSVNGKSVTVGSGSSNSGGNYNYGTSGSSDRGLGSLASSSTQRDTDAWFVNASDSSITALSISYSGEQWRVGGMPSVNNDLVLQFSSDGANWTALGAAFNFNSPVDSGSSGAIDGNDPANRVTGLGGTFTPPQPIAPSQAFYLRWADADNTQADHGMAVDDLIISFTFATNAASLLAVAPNSLVFGPVLTGLVAHASFVISNAGSGTLSGTASLAQNPFALTDAASNSVPNLNFAVPAQARTNLVVRFAPLSTGTFSNAVVILSSGGNATNAVTGVGFGTPVIVQLTSNPPEFLFSFQSVSGLLYDVQFKNSLDDPLWQTQQTLPGNDSTITITNLTASPSQRFYRLNAH